MIIPRSKGSRCLFISLYLKTMKRGDRHIYMYDYFFIYPYANCPSGIFKYRENGTVQRRMITNRNILQQCMLAGGVGGSTGDVLMHSLDTVKTRQQGAPNTLKYATMSDAYVTIFREEGFRRGLYGGIAPAFMGSLPGTVIFFGTYEYSKRHLIDMGCPDHLAYLTGGLVGDLFASIIYVPSEVLKTRLQLQGRYNNPFFKSGYNYRGTIDATRTIIRREGPAALFHGYKATIMRDLPFSALQFAFYEQFQKWAKQWCGTRDIGLPLEIATGAMAGGLAGTITCPLGSWSPSSHFCPSPS